MSKEEAQSLINQMQALEHQFIEINKNETAIGNILRDAHSSIDAIRALEKGDDFETLTPIGSTTFAKSQISSKNGFVINVGAGVFIEKDVTSTLNFLETRIQSLQVIAKNIHAQKQEIVNRLEQSKHEFNKFAKAANKSN